MDYATAKNAGLKVARLDSGACVLPLDPSPDVRICVPVGREGAFVAGCCGTRAPREIEVVSPEIWLLPPRQHRTLTCRGRARVMLMWLSTEEGAAPVADEFVTRDSVISRLARVLDAGFRVGRPPDSLFLEAVSRDLASHVARSYGRRAAGARARGLSDARLDKAMAFMEERLTDNVAVEDVAGHVNMSAFHFARMFKRSTGRSPHLYMTLRRVERAKELLTGAELSLAEISAMLGYATQAHFTGVFREYTGSTPKTYRDRATARRAGL